MELRSLKYFAVVAQELNITRAAEKLNMSQPPLSGQIKGLEEELGTQLFIRGKRHLRLTEAGALLLRRAVQILDLAEKTKQEIADMSGGMSGRISLGLVEGRPPFVAAQWISGFNEEFPLVRYSMWNGSGDEVLERLSNGLVDLAVVAVPYDNERYEGFCVASEPWVAIISRQHPLAKQEGDTVALSELKGEPLIIPARKSRKQAIIDWFSDVDAEPNILCEMSNYLDAVALAEQNAGIGIFPQTTYTYNSLAATKVIVDSERKAEYHLIWNKGQKLSAAAEEFINFVRDSAEEQHKQSDRLILPENEYIPAKDTPIL